MTYSSSSGCSDSDDSEEFVAMALVYSDSESGSIPAAPPRCCNRNFVNVSALGDHLRDAFVHRPRSQPISATPRPPQSADQQPPATPQTAQRRTPAQKPKDYDCDFCPRAFTTFPGLEQHRLTVHPDEKNVSCPFCKSKHASKSGMTAHMESGYCRSKITREAIDQHVFNATRGREGIASSIIRNDNPPLPPLPKFHATEDAKNRKGKYPCHFCPGMAFRSLGQLQQHLNTPKHARRIPDLYACPKCGFDGQTFSGLQQHVKMARCGARKDEAVRAALEEMTECLNGLRV